MTLKLTTFFISFFTLFVIIKLPAVRSLTDYEGKGLSFHCHITQPVKNVIWRYYVNESDFIADIVSVDKNILSTFDRSDRFRVEVRSDSSRLTIRNTQTSDTGIYKCSGERALLSTYHLHVVQRNFPLCQVTQVDFTGRPGKLKVNDNILLSCNSGFNSNYPRIRWLRGSNYTKIEETSQRNILQVRRTLKQEDEDVVFTCILGEGDPNSAPSCSLTPFPSQPVVSIVPTVANRTEKEEVVFECSGRVNFGNITYDWDEATLIRFAGRYTLNDDKSLLRISGLQASDNGTNLTCLVNVDTGTKGNGVAVLLVNKETKATTNRNLNDGNDGSGDGTKGSRAGNGGIATIMIGMMSVSVIAIILVIAVILIILRRKRSKNHPASLSPRIKSANFDEGAVRNTSQYYDDSDQYAVTGQLVMNGASKSEQVAFFSDEKSSGVQVTYAVAGQHDVSGNEKGEVDPYHQVDRSKELQQTGEASYAPEYHVIENSNDVALPVYAEVSKGSTEHLKFENTQSLDGTYELYTQVNTHDSAFTKPAQETVSEKKITEKPNYAKVNKNVKVDNGKIDDGYAKPDFTVSDENTCKEDENNLLLPSSPLYAEVEKSDNKKDEADATKHENKSKEKPKYAKVNKKPKTQFTSEPEA